MRSISSKRSSSSFWLNSLARSWMASKRVPAPRRMISTTFSNGWHRDD
ncbi:MAG TPA: hypothetical protein VFV88_17480 [Steroidobacteraceae bacterium]|nr:hypothetical protein [Steroidobacteraceae bacterium]